jgi:hypothetical protein
MNSLDERMNYIPLKGDPNDPSVLELRKREHMFEEE